MHTPDGLLTSWICIVMALASALPLLLAIRNLRREMTKDKAIKLASVAAIIFAAQMLNFPIGGGTSGHLIGAAFAFVALGLDGALVAMAAVLALQAVVFGDGGMLALGANIFNMGIVAVYAARFAHGRLGAFGASWAGVFAASLSCAGLLVLAGAPLSAFPAMGITHAVIGIGEGMITLLLLNLFWHRSVSLSKGVAYASIAVSVMGLAMLLPFASEAPDGLEKIAMDFGFYGDAITLYEAPVPDYSFMPEALGPYLSALAAGAIGTMAVFALAYSAAVFPSHRLHL
jgi:cobalt/nickel transport system permease protein